MVLKDLKHITYKRLIFSVSEYFLADATKPEADINYFIQCSKNTDDALSEFYTLLIDLNQSLEKIQTDIYHRTLSEINSFLSNQDFEHKILFDLSDKELNSFIFLFNQFALSKNFRKAEIFRLKAYNKHGILGVSYIKQKDKFLCINFYRVTKERACNLSSFTVNDAPGTGSHLGRAHRALHWLDLIEFKKEGVNYYDFCGWYNGQEDKNLLNINKFKEQFTKNKIKEYSGVIYKNKILVLLLKLVK